MNRVVPVCCLLYLASRAGAALLAPPAAAALPAPPAGDGPMLHLRAATFDPAAPHALSLSVSYPTAYQIVQCTGPIQPGWLDSLKKAGARTFDYVPYYAYVCALSPSAGMAVARLPFVRAVTPYRPEYKIDPFFARSTGRAAATVSLFPDADPAALTARARSIGLTAKAAGSYVTVSGDAALIASLAQVEGVRWIEAAAHAKILNKQDRPVMGIDQVWKDFGLYGEGQVIGFLDTGLDLGSPKTVNADFQGRVIDGMGLNSDNDWADRVGHGTHVAGTLAGAGVLSGADPDLKKFNRSFAGIAPAASLVVQEVDIDPTTGRSVGLDATTDLGPILDWAYQKGARIHNDSWGDDDAPLGAYSLHAAQVDRYVWEHPDFAVFFAAGNDGSDGPYQKEIQQKNLELLQQLNAMGGGTSSSQIAQVAAQCALGGDLSGALGGSGGLLGGSGGLGAPGGLIGGNGLPPEDLNCLLSGDPESCMSTSGSDTSGGTAAGSTTGSTSAGSTTGGSSASPASSDTTSGGTTSGGTTAGGTTSGSTTAGTTSDICQTISDLTTLMQDAQTNGKGKIDPGSINSPGTSKNAVTVGASEGNLPPTDPDYKCTDQDTSQLDLLGGLLGLGGGNTSSMFCTYQATGFPEEPFASDDMSDNINGMAAFSSRGPTLDGRIKPDVVAPGTRVISDRSALVPDTSIAYWATYDPHYAYAGGTSQATPMAAGSGALVREWLQKQRGQADPSAALIKALMANGAHDISPGQYPAPYQEEGPRPNSVEGWGRIDLASTLDPASPRTTLFSDETTGLATGASKQYAYRVAAGTPLAVTLAWSDYPGSPSAATALVNDLDLTVTGPDGKALAGNGAPDHVNNMEGVDIAAPQDGVYTVEIRGTNVPQGPQPYALVVSGAVQAQGAQALAGDLNGDGKVTTADAILALRIAVGALTPIPGQVSAGDVAPAGHPDGAISVADAMLILQSAIGLKTL